MYKIAAVHNTAIPLIEEKRIYVVDISRNKTPPQSIKFLLCKNYKNTPTKSTRWQAIINAETAEDALHFIKMKHFAPGVICEVYRTIRKSRDNSTSKKKLRVAGYEIERIG
jgi:hypothetical protein